MRSNTMPKRPSKKVCGASFIFILNGNNGVFTKQEIRWRVPLNAVSQFTCIWNTNIQCLVDYKKLRGVSVIVNILDRYKLCFPWIWRKGEYVILEWKGVTNDNGIPSFLFTNQHGLQREWKDHFTVRTLCKIKECYFVNLQPPYQTSIPMTLCKSGDWIRPNPIDGCISQSKDGPCRVWIPKIDTKHSEFTASVISSKRKCRGGNRLHDRRTKVDWLVRPTMCNDIVYDVIYVKQESTKNTFPKDGLMWIPQSNEKQNKDVPLGWSLQSFFCIVSIAKIDVPNGEAISKIRQFTNCNGNQIVKRLVHHGKHLRVQVCNQAVYDTLRDDNTLTLFQWGGGKEAYFSKSNLPVQELKGVNVSTWSVNDNLLSLKKLNIQFAEDVYDGFYNGFGSRVTSKSRGINMYFGQRDSNRPKLAPFVGPLEASEQEYFRQRWSKGGDECKRLQLEETIVGLPATENVLMLSKNYSQWIGLEVCDKTILTLGIPRGIFSFVNETHIDRRDVFNEAIRDFWLQKLDHAPSRGEGQKKVVSTIRETCLSFDHQNPSVCCPTTCAYRYLWEVKDNGYNAKLFENGYNAYQHFDYPSFGIAKSILDASVHWMLAAYFHHRTCLCIVICNGNVYWKASNDIPKFTLLAWGRTGGTVKKKNLEERSNRM